MVDFFVQMADLKLGFQIDFVIVFRPQPVARLGAMAVKAAAAVNYLRPIPAVSATHLLRTSEVVPGVAPALPWPARGSGAVGVSGLGLIASSGNEQAIPAASVTKVMTALVILTDKPLEKGATGPTITLADADVQWTFTAMDQAQSGRDLVDVLTRLEDTIARPRASQQVAQGGPGTDDSSAAGRSAALIRHWRATRILFDGKGGAKTAERWDVGKRIRDVEQGPDGSLWMLEDANPGALIHVTPK